MTGGHSGPQTDTAPGPRPACHPPRLRDRGAARARRVPASDTFQNTEGARCPGTNERVTPARLLRWKHDGISEGGGCPAAASARRAGTAPPAADASLQTLKVGTERKGRTSLRGGRAPGPAKGRRAPVLGARDRGPRNVPPARGPAPKDARSPARRPPCQAPPTGAEPQGGGAGGTCTPRLGSRVWESGGPRAPLCHLRGRAGRRRGGAGALARS